MSVGKVLFPVGIINPEIFRDPVNRIGDIDCRRIIQTGGGMIVKNAGLCALDYQYNC
jgi:hypothetical protein